MSKLFIKMHHPVINYKYLIYFIDFFLVYMYNQSIDGIFFNYKFSFRIFNEIVKVHYTRRNIT